MLSPSHHFLQKLVLVFHKNSGIFFLCTGIHAGYEQYFHFFSVLAISIKTGTLNKI